MRKLPGPAGFQDNSTLVNNNEHPEEIDLNEKNTQVASLEIQRMIKVISSDNVELFGILL